MLEYQLPSSVTVLPGKSATSKAITKEAQQGGKANNFESANAGVAQGSKRTREIAPNYGLPISGQTPG
jgi:hypothetical protein